MRTAILFVSTWILLPSLAGAAGAAEAPPPAKVRQVIIAFKTHFDIGYTALASQVVARYRTTMIDGALEVVDRSRDLRPEERFIWMMPGWPLAKIVEDGPGQTPERKRRVLDAFRAGRFAVHALPFTTHTETLELEDLVRGMGFASRLSRDAGLDLPRDAKMTDVPCHAWAVPTLLRHAGVDFLHLGCNAASSSPVVPALFFWEGPDGSRVLTMYSAAGYGTGLVPPKDWPHDTWLALIHTGDNHGPPTPDEVRKLLDDARKTLPGVDVRIGRLSDFADAILAGKRDLPVVRGDMPDTWIHGPMCDPAGASTARVVRPLIAAAESLGAHLAAWGAGAADPAGAVAAAREGSLLYGEHTWGGALYWVTEYAEGKVKFPWGEAWKAEREKGRFARLEESWREHTAYIDGARKAIAPVAAEEMSALVRAVAVDGPRVTVWNPLPWRRSAMVTAPWGGAHLSALAPAGGGDAVPCEDRGDALRFLAADLPPGGYRTYVPAKAEAAAPPSRAGLDENTIESPFFRAVIDRDRGTVRSLIEKRTGRELVDAAAPHGLGQYLYERFDAGGVQAYREAYVKIDADWAVNELGKPPMPPASEIPYRAASSRGFKCRIEETPLAAAAVLEASAGKDIPHPVTLRVVLPRSAPWVDLEITLHGKPMDPWPEAGWLCFPLAVERPRYLLGRLGSVVDPARDLVPGANRDLFWLNGGIAAIGPDGRGAGLCPVDHPLVSIGRPGCWRYSKDFAPERPAVYVNLFNNQWSTNFRLWNGGTWTSRVRLWAADGADAETALVTPSWETRCPPLVAASDGPAGKLPPEAAGLEVSRKGILATAFGRNPDGEGIVLRLWEMAGRPGPCEVRLPEGLRPDQVQPVDLRGRPAGKPVAVQDGRFTIPVDAFAPASVTIR